MKVLQGILSNIEYNVSIIISLLFSVPVLFLVYHWFGGNRGHVGNDPKGKIKWRFLL